MHLVVTVEAKLRSRPKMGDVQVRSNLPGGIFFPQRCSDKAFALGLLASELAGSADRFTLFPRRFFGWLLVKSPALHLAKNAFALHFLLEYSESLIDVVVANDYLQETFLSGSVGLLFEDIESKRSHSALLFQ